MYHKKEESRLNELTKALSDKPVAEEDYADLVSVLQYHEWRYYVQNDPLMSDYDYDQMYKRLETLESNHPTLITLDSPTQRVSSDLSSDFPTVTHLNPMLSLDNSYDKNDLEEFDLRVKKKTELEEGESIPYFVEPKYDGGSVAIIYEDDLYQRAATRGNGTEGEEITANLKTLATIPLKAAFSMHGIHRVELRGEAVIAHTTFKDINEKREKKGLAVFANPRNAATGALRMKDPNETRKRGLEVFIFQIAHAEDKDGNDMMPQLKTHSHAVEILKSLGFKVSLNKDQLCKDISAASVSCQKWEQNREAFEYEMDGAVVKVNELALQARCGSTQHHPRWAIAFKFKAKQAHTRLETIEYQIGKTGAITPVAKTTPVQLAGVTVSSISLHNEEFIKQKDLRVGDMIVIERAGDVIPYVVKSLADLRKGDEKVIEFPTACPSCATPLSKAESEAAWRCPSPSCKAQLQQRLIFHVSKDAMNIDGFGKAYVELFMEKEWLNDLSDVYDLDYDAMAAMSGFGQRSAQKLEAAITKAKSNPLHRLLHSLSIHHLGRKASKLLAQEIDHVLDLKGWTLEQFTDIKDIGPVVAEKVMDYFSIEENLTVLKKMEALGVNVKQTEADKPRQVKADAPLIGKTILFTGSLQTMSRKEAQAKAEEAGAKNLSSVSAKLDILVVGEKAGSKLKKAQALGSVQIMTEQEFNETVG